MRNVLVAAVAVVLAFFSNQAFAADNLSPTDDAFTQSSLPNNSFGNNVGLTAANQYGTVQNSYLNFDLSQYATISSAYLNLYKNLGTGTIPVNVYATTPGWSESTLTWNTQPAPTSGAVTVNVGTNAWYVWNVTSFAQAAVGSDLSLVLTAASGSKRFYSDDNTNGLLPYLSVTGTAPVAPEPISAGLFLLGGGVLAAIRRRKA